MFPMLEKTELSSFTTDSLHQQRGKSVGPYWQFPLQKRYEEHPTPLVCDITVVSKAAPHDTQRETRLVLSLPDS